MTPPVWPEQRAVEVADGVVAVVHGNGEAGVSNAGLVIDDGGEERTALVVDTMMFPAMANGLRDELTRRGARPRLVVNTHPHIDHVGGNAAFADVPVVAHPVVGETVRATGLPVAIFDAFMPAFRGEFEKLGRVEPPAPVASPEDIDALRLPKGAQLRSYVPAHTPADTAVWLANDGVLFTGDLCFLGVSPLAIQGLVSAWVAALDDLIALAPDVVVPGHGPVGTTRDVAIVRDHLATLLEVGRAAVAAGASIDDAYAELDAGPVGGWIEAERIKPNLERAMQEARGDIAPGRLDALPPSAYALLH
ncbi:MAG TPA: MBL fold metallo-hydrolase [Acidimicrobiales bacterium]